MDKVAFLIFDKYFDLKLLLLSHDMYNAGIRYIETTFLNDKKIYELTIDEMTNFFDRMHSPKIEEYQNDMIYEFCWLSLILGKYPSVGYIKLLIKLLDFLYNMDEYIIFKNVYNMQDYLNSNVLIISASFGFDKFFKKFTKKLHHFEEYVFNNVLILIGLFNEPDYINKIQEYLTDNHSFIKLSYMDRYNFGHIVTDTQSEKDVREYFDYPYLFYYIVRDDIKKYKKLIKKISMENLTDTNEKMVLDIIRINKFLGNSHKFTAIFLVMCDKFKKINNSFFETQIISLLDENDRIKLMDEITKASLNK